MQRAAEAAADDAGSRELLGALDSIWVPQGLWRYANPGALLAERLGAPAARSGLGPISGSTVQWMLSRAALEVMGGRRRAVLVVGGEAEHSARRAKRAGLALAWTEQTAGEPDERFGTHDPGFGWWELRYRARPIQAFSLYENALRFRSGEAPAAHRKRIARLQAGFARVAARNPYAWIRDAPSAEAIEGVTADNRMLGYPYTKRMVANMVVDQAAAVLLCSLETARRLGVPEERWVFPQAATDAMRTAAVPERPSFDEEAAMRLAGRRVLELAEAAPGDFAHVDLYSCFPSAVQIAAAEIGFDLERELTVTGGLTFAGGPFNSYVLHAIATLMGRLRSAPGTRGFVSSVGGYMAKHAFGVYGSEPRDAGFLHACLDEEAALLPTRPCRREYEGRARVETFAVMPSRGEVGPSLLCACRTPDDARAWATCTDPDLVSSVAHEELCGREGRVRAGELHLD